MIYIQVKFAFYNFNIVQTWKLCFGVGALFLLRILRDKSTPKYIKTVHTGYSKIITRSVFDFP